MNLSKHLGNALFKGVCGLIFLFLLLPTVIVMPASFSATQYLSFPPSQWSLRWYVAYFQDPEWIAATLFSLKVAGLTTVAAVVLGTMGALALMRGRMPLKGAMRAVVLAPMIVPHIVIAVAMYMVYMKWNLLGSLTGFVLAHTVVCVPFVVINVSAGLQKMDPSLEMAAASLGANRLRAFRHVTLPLLGPSMATSAAFAFITSLDEAVISYFLSSSTEKTLTRKMFEDIDFDLSPTIAVVSTLIIVVSVLLMGTIEGLRARAARRAKV
ncbi:ABC transporter permease [Azospirillum sp. TSO22-1]|nr:ABC transporter permease [Azospirillum sp. TSO22-1]